MTGPASPRQSPCATCPYRLTGPSGVWDAAEYAKLPAYDAETFAQPVATFMCHHADGQVCAGWLGHTHPADLLAVRIGISSGALDPACATYSTPTALHPSGASAAAHGMRDLEQPGVRARRAIANLTRLRHPHRTGPVMTLTLRDFDNRDDDGNAFEFADTPEGVIAYLDEAVRTDLTDPEDGVVLDAAIAAIRADDIDRADAELRHFAVRLTRTEQDPT